MPRANSERTAQKARTREALLASTRALIADGEPVTVQRVAERAGISKATAYRYFSDPNLMVAEAGMAVSVAPFDDVVAGCATPREKALAVSLYMFDFSVQNEAAFRNFLARNLDTWLAEGGAQRERRGARRVQMFEAALSNAPLGPSERRALVSALSAATGAEAMVALFDVVQVDPDAARETIRVTAEALLDRMLPDSGP